MSKLLPIAFGAILAASLGTYDYIRVSREQATDAALGLAEPQGYLASLRERFWPATDAPVSFDLADHLRDPPRGWDVAAYDSAGGTLLTGQKIAPPTALRSATNDLLHHLERLGNGDGRAATWSKGGAVVVVALFPGPPPTRAETVRADYALLRGLPLALLEQADVVAATATRTDVPYRRLAAPFGPEAELLVATTAEDADLAAVLATIDLPTLALALGVEIDGLSAEKPVFVGTSAVKDALAPPEPEAGSEEDIVAEAEPPKGPCVRRGTVLTCE